jgi:hypothetical protein
MRRFAKHYFVALAGLLLSMGVYWLTVLPAIEPPPRAATPLPEFTTTLGGNQWWQSFFASNSWQSKNPKIVQSNRAILLSDAWEQIGPKTLKLQPLTMILPQSGSTDTTVPSDTMTPQNVWIVSAEEGAVIHFEKPLNLTSGAIPSVERGELSGAIEITRRSLGKTKGKPWSLRTSDVSINRSRVFTQNDVTIEWQDGIIQGHDMRLTLQGDLLSSTSKETSPWGPLRTLDLYHVDKIDLALPTGGLWSSVGGPPAEHPDLLELPARLSVQCGGRFTFDFTRSRATLLNGVHVTHQLEGLPADEFMSQQVMLDLQPPASQPATSKAESLSLGGIQLRQLEAVGIDSLENFVGERKVEIRAPTMGAFANAKRLKINLLENRIELDGKLSHAGATQSTAWMKYLGYEFSAPRIDYDADGSGKLAIADHLGYLVASGAGELRMPANSSLGETLVRWQDSLEMRPTEAEGLQWVGLYGNVLIENHTHGYMAGDNLEVWLRKTQTDPASAGNASQGSLSEYQPERLHSKGEISISTGQLNAQVAELSIALHTIPRPAKDGGLDNAQLVLSDSAGPPNRQWIEPPNNSNTTAAAPIQSGSSKTAKPNNPVVIRGTSLTSTIIMADNQSWVDDLTISGPVTVVGQASPTGMSDWRVEGDQLRLATNPRGQVDLQVSGNPARVAMADGSLNGSTIRFDQESNLLWMDQPGEFTIPVSALNTTGSANPSVDWFKPPHCKWQGHMLFDGRIVRIEGKIRFDGAVRTASDQFWWIEGDSEALQFELSETVDMDRPQMGTAKPLRITVSHNVDIRASQVDRAGNNKSREQLQLPSLTFDIQSNEFIGLGPGSVRSWHLSKPGLGSTASSSGAIQNSKLQGAHLVFRDSMRGFLSRSEIYFQGKVELAVGPLRSWTDSIDLARMQQLSMDQLLLGCDLLKVYDTSGLSTTSRPPSGASVNKSWEFQAKGNVTFEGKTESGDYEGNGTEVAYVQQKELLLLWGEPRRPAHIKRTPANRAAEGAFEASVEYVAIHPKTLSIESYKVGQNGIRVELPTGAPETRPLPGTSLENRPIPNPRGTAQRFLSAQDPLAEKSQAKKRQLKLEQRRGLAESVFSLFGPGTRWGQLQESLPMFTGSLGLS